MTEQLLTFQSQTGLKLEKFGGLIYRVRPFDFHELDHFGTLTCHLLMVHEVSIENLGKALATHYGRTRKELEKDLTAFLEELPWKTYLTRIEKETPRLASQDLQKAISELERAWDELEPLEHYRAPLQFHWEITRECNLGCLHCYARPNRIEGAEVDTLDWDHCLKTLDSLANMGVVQVNFLGGEPMIEQRFLELCEEAARRGLDVTFPTNGLLITVEKLARLKQIGLSSLTISLDSPEAKTYDRLRGQKGAHEKVIENIQLAKASGFQVIVNAVLTKLNHNQFDSLVELLVELEVDMLKVIDEFPVGRGLSNMEDLLISQDEYRQFYHHMLNEIKPRYEGQLEISLSPRFTFMGEPEKPTAEPFDYRCSAGRSQCFCTVEGDILPCYLFYDAREFKVANLKEQDLATIWNEPTNFEDFRHLVGPIQECQGCAYGNSCQGGCRGVAYKLTGEFLARDPYCWNKPSRTGEA